MLNVPVRKIIFSLLILAVITAPAFGQRKTKFRHPFDLRPFNLGFSMGLNYNTFDMTGAVNLTDRETGIFLRDIDLQPMPGISLGLITNFNLKNTPFENNFDIRFTPCVTLEQRNIRFNHGMFGDSVVVKKVESSDLNLPIAIKFKSNYYSRVRVYCTAGMQYSINMVSTKKVRNDPSLIKVERGDLTWTASFGVDLYGDRLKLSPEIRYSRGITNIYSPKNTSFANAISDLHSQSITFLLNFE